MVQNHTQVKQNSGISIYNHSLVNIFPIRFSARCQIVSFSFFQINCDTVKVVKTIPPPSFELSDLLYLIYLWILLYDTHFHYGFPVAHWSPLIFCVKLKFVTLNVFQISIKHFYIFSKFLCFSTINKLFHRIYCTDLLDLICPKTSRIFYDFLRFVWWFFIWNLLKRSLSNNITFYF